MLYKHKDQRSELHTHVNAEQAKGLSVILAHREMNGYRASSELRYLSRVIKLVSYGLK